MTKLVLDRGLIEPGVDMEALVLENDAFLAELAGIWRSHPEAIKALLRARIYPIERDLVGNATPAEVIILRQAIIEVALIGDDLERYATEFERREKLRKEGEGEQPAPTIEDKPVDAGGNGESAM